MQPTVSVIMPIYNAEKYVKMAIDSILGQTYADLELLLINDHPTDSTMDIVYGYKDERIRIIHNKVNSGIAFSRNVGLENSTGKYIALLDDDDIALPDRLKLEVNFLESRKDIGIVGGRCEIIDEEGNFLGRTSTPLYNPKFIKAVYLFKNVYMNGTVMMRKDIIDQNHLRYKENCLGMEDFHFWIECSKVCDMSSVDEILMKYRMHPDNESSRVASEKSEDRKKLYAEFQRYSLYESGFRLSEEYLQVINKVMPERNGSCENWEEAMLFQKALKEIIHQAEQMQCDNLKEIIILCKRTFADKISIMESLWD